VAFYRDAQALVEEYPASRKAQARARRWLDLTRRAWFGDLEAAADSPAAWLDRALARSIQAARRRVPNGGGRQVYETGSARIPQGMHE
jgi:hypothetical protein